MPSAAAPGGPAGPPATEFYLPYQFVPVTGRVNCEPTQIIPWDQIESGQDTGGRPSPTRHDLWLPGTHSGRILCRLELVTPTFVGARQVTAETEGCAKTVEHYQRRGDRAIPANSLRGMIGSLVEGLSQSALRVLEDRHYSVRKPARREADIGPLSAVGRVRKDGADYFIEPLTLPILTPDNTNRYRVKGPWAQVFAGAKWRECLPAYLHDYFHPNNPQGEGKTTRYDNGSFLHAKRHKLKSGGIEPYARWYGLSPLGQGAGVEDPLPASTPGLHISRHGHLLLGQELQGSPSAEPIEGGIPGMLRVLGIEGRETEIPPTKTHELFIPEPGTERTPLLIPGDVLQRFSRLIHELAVQDKEEEPAGARRPYFPKGYERYRPKDPDPKKTDVWRPEPGMLLYFDIRPDAAGNVVVSEISFSAIWRKEVEGSSFDFFRKIDFNLIPWGNDGRTHLTPAEALFGVVEDRPARAPGPGKNLASRLRFHDALPEYRAGQTKVLTLGEAKPLRILASPKPPSPALYFEPDNDRKGHIRKTQLGKGGHRPKGRKHYLHLPEEQIAARWWQSRETGHADQKLCCDPTQAGEAFWFHIDFDNLTAGELTLLRTALEPDPGFQHRLGLGKPLGLGSVKVRIQAVLTLDTDARYSCSALAETARYHQVHVADPTQVPAWPARYAADIPAPGEHGYRKLSDVPGDAGLIDADTLSVLCRLGDPKALKPGAWVHHPLIASQLPTRGGSHGDESELKIYAWHVQNEKAPRPAALPPVETGDPYLPPLPVWMPMEVTGLPNGQSFTELRKALEAEFGRFGPVVANVHKAHNALVAEVLMSAKDGQKAMAALDGTMPLGYRLTIRCAKP